MCTSRTVIGSSLWKTVLNVTVTSVTHTSRGWNSQVSGTKTTPEPWRMRASPSVSRGARGLSGAGVKTGGPGGLLTLVPVDALSSEGSGSNVTPSTDAVFEIVDPSARSPL